MSSPNRLALTQRAAFWKRPKASRLTVLALIAAAVLLVELAAPIVWRLDPTAIDLLNRLQPPNPAHPFGTDGLGRDILARFIAGARLSIAFGLITTFVAAALGALIGAASGLLGGLVDGIIMRTLDALLAFPALLLALAVALALGAGVAAAAVAVVVSSVPWFARRVRSEVLSLRARPYIDAERVMGASRMHILLRHLLRAVVAGVVVQASLAVGWAILTLAALGFIGLGVQPPAAEWGAMITDGRAFLLGGQWWVSVIPGVGILVFVALATLLGDALSDALGIRDVAAL